MRNKKDISYENARKYLTNKDTALNTFMRNAYNKTINMYRYENLPDTIPQNELEKLLQYNGHCIIAKVNNNLYALAGDFTGEPDAYNNPTQYTVANVGLNLTRTFNIGVDCVLIKNDFEHEGLYPIFAKYAVNMIDTDISMNLANIMLRIPMLISAPDDKTKASAELFIKKIYDGEFSIIGDMPFLDGVKMQNATNNNSRYITQYIELMQYYKASFYNEIGLNANYNMKRERLTENETAMNIDAILPLVDEMYSERVEGIEEVNKMFDTEIVVDYNSTWKTTHEEEEKETAFTNTPVEDDIEENAENESANDIPEVEETEPEETEETEETETETDTETEPETETETESETETETETETEETEAEPEEPEERRKENEKS